MKDSEHQPCPSLTTRDLAPTGLHVEYYRQRAAAGLILTEGTWISLRAIGFINVPASLRNAKAQRRANLQIGKGRQLWK